MVILTHPGRVEDLTRFLRMVGFVVQEVDYGEIEVGRPSSGVGLALTVDEALSIWLAVNRGAAAHVVREPVQRPNGDS